MKISIVRLAGTLSLIVLLFTLPLGCEKDKGDNTPNSITGLWVGNYKVDNGSTYFFSFSIFPDGKLSYKSKGLYMGSPDYITFADGTWSLNGSNFTFSVTTINIAGGGVQHNQYGSATFNLSNGTFTNGEINDPLGGSATWTMTKVD